MLRIMMVAVLGVTLTSTALAGSELDTALANGGSRLTADQIAAKIVGKTVTASLGEKRFLFHYSENNLLSGQLIDGNWSDAGYYGITDDDRVCLSMSKDKGRLRCLTLVELSGIIRKYNSAGKATFTMLEFRNGKTF